MAITIEEIIQITGAQCDQNQALFKGIASLDRASCGDVSFFHRANQKEALLRTQAGACLIKKEFVKWLSPHVIPLITPCPYRSFVLLARALHPEPPVSAGRHPTAWIDPCATVHDSCRIGPNVVIHSGAVVGPECVIDGPTVIGENVHLGAQCRIEGHVTLSYAHIGQGVWIKAGTRIGQAGFGFLIEDAQAGIDIPHLGKVIIGQHVHIGANCTIDRGSFQDTQIGEFSRIDNLVQIAHNVVIGKHVIMAAQCGISGSSHIGDGCLLGGQVGIADHVHLAKGTKVAAKSGVMRSSQEGEMLAGIPAMPIVQWRRYVVRRGKI